MKTIGILGGLSPESTIAYYGYITRRYHQLRGDFAYPEIVIYSVRFSEFIEAGYQIAGRVKGAIERLHRAGADFVVAACNSVHVVFDEVSADVPIPWISIMDAVAEQIRRAGIRRVGLLGTVFTMGGEFYQKGLAKYGIETLTPDERSQKRINAIIYDELVKAQVREDSRRFVVTCIDELSQRGAEGVVLGCTELPFLIRQEDTSVPVFDTTTIHAQKALDLALADDAAA